MGLYKGPGKAIATSVDILTGLPKDVYGNLLQQPDYGSNHPMELPKSTDPFGALEFAVGTGNDFTCFDYAIVTGKRRHKFLVLHSVVDSMTGSFIQDGEYKVIPLPDYKAGDSLNMIDSALDWLCDPIPLRHHKKGWNQDPYYFHRCVFLAVRRELGMPVPKFSEREKRFGGKKINKFTEVTR